CRPPRCCAALLSAQQHGGLARFDDGDLDVRSVALQYGRDTAGGRRSPDRVHEGVDVPARLRPDLLAQRKVPGDAAGRVLPLQLDEYVRAIGRLDLHETNEGRHSGRAWISCPCPERSVYGVV